MSLLRGRRRAPSRNGEEAEKPFWISFSDLMSALMVLFLVALTVALMVVTHDVSRVADLKEERETEIERLMRRLQASVERFPGVVLRGSVIDFGERARFETNSHRLLPEQGGLLRAFVPSVLALARDPAGEKWIKRIVVEGYADPRGSYLHNLDLSLRRSERVLCVLLFPEQGPEVLSEADRQLVRELFRVAGASYNSQRDSADASRRIELRLEFWQTDEEKPALPSLPQLAEQRCPLDAP
ncbi:MAG: flagellar motor protein MotB [Dechloromonas sp.]|nr:flagellar motor protein MotB [Dechloromonas sp.]